MPARTSTCDARCHLELHTPAEIDDEVRAWLQEAWDAAGRRAWG